MRYYVLWGLGEIVGLPIFMAGTPPDRRVMLYILAIVCSPLAVLFAGKPFQALFNFIFWLLAVALEATIVLYHTGFILWLVAFIHAVLVIHGMHEDRRARMIANALRR